MIAVRSVRTPPFFLVLLILALSAVLGCESGGPTALSVYIVSPTGDNPVEGIRRGDLTVRINQDGASETIEVEPIERGLFDLPVSIYSYAPDTWIQADADDLESEIVLLGATPHFPPYNYVELSLVIGPPDRCATLSTPDLPTALESPALVAFDDTIFVFGGVGSGETRPDEVHYFSAMTLTLDYPVQVLSLLADSPGLTQAVPLHTDPDRNRLALVVGESDAVIYDAAVSTMTGAVRDTEIDLHVGAGVDSTVLALGDDGAVVVGGTDSAGITFVNAMGVARSDVMSTSRRRPAVVRWGSGVLVAGGAAPGSALVEWLPIAGGAGMAARPDLAQRDGANLVLNTTNDAALLVYGRRSAGETDEGMLETESFVITGCPACVVAPGPDVASPRANAVAIRRPSLSAGSYDRDPSTIVLGGETGDVAAPEPTNAVDSITWSGREPTITASGALDRPRSGHTAVELANGVVLVAGGTDGTSLLDELEICF